MARASYYHQMIELRITEAVAQELYDSLAQQWQSGAVLELVDQLGAALRGERMPPLYDADMVQRLVEAGLALGEKQKEINALREKVTRLREELDSRRRSWWKK